MLIVDLGVSLISGRSSASYAWKPQNRGDSPGLKYAGLTNTALGKVPRGKALLWCAWNPDSGHRTPFMVSHQFQFFEMPLELLEVPWVCGRGSIGDPREGGCM